MVNTFGNSSSQQFPLYNPVRVRENRARFRRDLFPELDRANSYYMSAGRWPDAGWLLVDRTTWNALDHYSNALVLTIGDFINDPVTISNLSIVQARCVTRGVADDPKAIYLLQVTNNKGVIYNPWFQFPANVQYDVRAPAYDGTYYSGSTNGSAAWTWDGMVGDLWALAPLFLGAYPGLPITPLQAPEGFSFVGVPLWEAISDVMDYLGLSVAGSYPNHTIVVPGNADATYDALVARYAKYLEDSMDYQDIGSGRVPKQVEVLFHRRNHYYGTEETVRYDTPQWQNTPAYSVTVPAPSSFTSALGTGYLWADYTVRYDQDGNPLAADVAQALATATERAAQYFATFHRGTQGMSRRTYLGALPFTTGSLVDGVRWFQTGRLSDNRTNDRAGWRTEVIRGYVWPELVFPQGDRRGPTF